MEATAIEIINIKKQDGPPDEQSKVIHVGDIMGQLTHYDKHQSPLQMNDYKKCCGANGRIQLHLTTKADWVQVTYNVKKTVDDYTSWCRSNRANLDAVLRLTS